jgi:uncharacterized repeat protein (TIGR03847 family)
VSLEFDPVTSITTGAVGEPGQRTFYLQARKDDTMITLLVEKQQVAVLSQLIGQLIARLAAEGNPDAGRTAELQAAGQTEAGLTEPLEPYFRVGQMALGYDAERDLFLLQCDEIRASDTEEDDEADLEEIEDIGDLFDTEGVEIVRFWTTRTQMETLAERGAASVAAGRPICRMCGGSIDPEGHFCPGGNGHRPTDEIA